MAPRVERDIVELESSIGSYGADRAVVAYSGGVDSTVVVALAARSLGVGAVTAVTAVSPSYPAGELASAREVVATIGVAHRTVRTHEVERDAYARNDAMRCFHCKTELYATLGKLVTDHAQPGTVFLAGANADDAKDFRPGLEAARQRGVRNPLLEADIGKTGVRAIAERLGLAVADKPALACLSSRVAYGVRITPELLARIDTAERAVRAVGFDIVRVRHLGENASIEVATEDLVRFKTHPRLSAVLEEIRSLGWHTVSVDPDGYRSGSLNVLLGEEELARARAARHPSRPAYGSGE